MTAKVTAAAPSTVDGASKGRPLGTRTLRWLYLVIAGLHLVGILVLPAPGRLVAAAGVGVLAVLSLGFGIRHFRPTPATAWWLILVGIGTAALSGFGLMLSAGVPDLTPVMVGSDVLRLLRYLLLAAGLVLLSRSIDRRSELANTIDAGVAGAGLFLLLWAVIIAPAMDMPSPQPAIVLVITPAAALVVFAMTVKLAFTVDVRPPALLLLIIGVTGVLAAPIVGLAVGPPSTMVWLPRLLVWGGIAVVGAAGLHPSLSRTGATPSRPTVGPSRLRVLLFAALALLGPYAWLVEVWDAVTLREDSLGYLVPIITSAILGLLLVARLAMMARVAQERADDLAQQATTLGEAVREQETLQRQLTYRALHDPLTGLANRVVLAERMEWALSRRDNGHVTLILLDLDGFKDINDTYGHPTGDEVLIEVARRLVEGPPKEGILARLGGDEFALFVEDVDPRQARAWADGIRRGIARPFQSNGHDMFLTVSIGLFVNAPERRVTPSTALSDADLALYAAKDGGRNRVVCYQPHLRRVRLDRTRMSTGLRQALVDDEFSLQYQPVVDLTSERIIAVEALLRWTRHDGQRIPPAAFIPIAEETGVINSIGAWVLRQACADAVSWHRDHGVAVSVNVSGRQLDDLGFADLVIDALATADLPGAALILELTETTLVSLSGTAVAVAQLRRLRSHGVRVAVDDFGTGYSSLAYVSRLPVDIIKLDRSFTQDSGSDPSLESWAFIRAILQLVDSVGLQTVAEGIETPEQAEVLRQLRCPLAQGYLFSRPVSADVIDRALVAADTVR